jgi:hypothetical protein
LQLFIKYYIIFILVVRFNPYIKTTYTNFDRQIAFSAGLFLLISSSFFDYVDNYIHIRSLIKN